MVLCTNDSSISSDVVEQGHMSTRKIVTNEKFITLERGNKMFVIFSSTEKKKYIIQLEITLFRSDLYSHCTPTLISKNTSNFLLMRLAVFVILQISLFWQVADCVCLKIRNCLRSLYYFQQLLPLGSILRIFIMFRLVKKKYYLFCKRIFILQKEGA